MGYIAPVNHEQYTQYANRTIHRKYNYMKLAPVQRSFLSSHTNRPNEIVLESRKETANMTKEVDRVLTELTGKGLFVNELI
ncbi:hypothetical protein PY093_14890 [Cytobacillus sp. S13-E01]|uniref:hypothetical protein n=1 Tax=Cytobacillus sp. S13-E01 TaxID=3031326 RepID=UPI0023D7E0FB|nr:hypothetical protein [Cytobacillus sp. S13-E01]MDF0727962.1 hypothetical protein [Cytobacillus sp. S13-E01]